MPIGVCIPTKHAEFYHSTWVPFFELPVVGHDDLLAGLWFPYFLCACFLLPMHRAIVSRLTLTSMTFAESS